MTSRPGDILDRIAAAGCAPVFAREMDAGQELLADRRSGRDQDNGQGLPRTWPPRTPYLGYEISTERRKWAELAEQCGVEERPGNWQGGWERQPYSAITWSVFQSEWQDRWLEGSLGCSRIRLRRVYLDGTTIPWGSPNAAHGCGCTRADGRRGLTYPVFAVRRLMRRLYEIVNSRGGLVTVHQSSCCVTPILSFCHSYWDGEHVNISVEAYGGWKRLWPRPGGIHGQELRVPCEFCERPAGNAGADALHNVTIRPDFVPRWTPLHRSGVR